MSRIRTAAGGESVRVELLRIRKVVRIVMESVDRNDEQCVLRDVVARNIGTPIDKIHWWVFPQGFFMKGVNLQNGFELRDIPVETYRLSLGPDKT